MSKHRQDDTFSDFLFFYKFSLILLCTIVNKIPFPCSERGYDRYILCHRYSKCIVFSTEYVLTCIYVYIFIYKGTFLLFSDVIQLDILRCANKTLYNQSFHMDTLYQRITFTYFVPHCEIHWWAGSNKMTGLNIWYSDTFVRGRLWNNTSWMLMYMYVLLVLVYNTVRFNTILRTAWQRQWQYSG